MDATLYNLMIVILSPGFSALIFLQFSAGEGSVRKDVASSPCLSDDTALGASESVARCIYSLLVVLFHSENGCPNMGGE